MRPDPDLLNELYHRQRSKYPNELPFPERFNLKLTEDIFNKGKRREKVDDIQKIVDWQGNPIRDEPVTVIEYEAGSRLDLAIEKSAPKSYDLKTIYSQFYDNIQLGSKNEELDLEYNFFFHALDKRVHTMLVAYDTREVYAKSFYGDTLKVRIQYAQRIVNSAGPRYDCYGYIYIPKRKTQ